MGKSRTIVGAGLAAFLCTAAVFGAAPPTHSGADSTHEVGVDPDAGLTPLTTLERRSFEVPPSIALGGSGECEEIGSFARVFQASNRLRGNWYDFEQPGVLTEIQFYLNLPSPTALWFFVYKERADEENIFDQVWAAELAAGPSGEQFYASPPVGGGEFPLDADASYIIGVGWGNTNVVFGRSDTGVGPFSRGQVRGVVGLDQAPPPPNPPDGVEFIDPFDRGAYRSQLCFAPDPGACCEGSVCRDDLDATGCLNLGGDFAGPNTTCEDVVCPLPIAACCIDTACIDELTQFECENIEGGVWADGLRCVDEPCSPRGACCVDGGCAPDVTERQCLEDIGGVYRGDGVACEEFPGCNAGACCLGDFCGRGMTQQACEAADGVYQGPGSTCERDTCDPEGACCLADGSCLDGQSASACDGMGGAYRGDGTTCGDLDPACGRGACCGRDFGCVDGRTRSQCEGAPVFGTWRGDGSTCEALDPRCPGSCCVNGTTCEEDDWTPELCEDFNGVFLGYGVDCFPEDPCEDAGMVDCCLGSSYTCVTVESANVCTSIGGIVGCDRCFECDDNGDCDNGVFCDGAETCVDATCRNGSDPCPGEACDEGDDACVECLSNTDCPGGTVCDQDANVCVECLVDGHCNDGLFCNGTETCMDNGCVPGAEPCVDIEHCDESRDLCLECLDNAECDDGLFCTGVEECVNGGCVPGEDPCPEGQRCREAEQDCVEGCVRDPEWQCDGDVDGDGQVNPVDTGLVQSAFGSSDDQDLCNYDLDCDGQINPVDAGLVQSLFGTCEPPRAECP